MFIPFTKLARGWQVCIEIIFPVRDDAARIRSCNSLLPYYSVRQTAGIVSLLPFQESSVRAAIHELKFHKNLHATRLLASALEHFLKDRSHKYDYMIPIPLSAKRRRARGYNQVELLISAATLPPDLQMLTTVLQKHRDNAPQTGLCRKDRLKNITEAYSVNDRQNSSEKLFGKRILLVDDVSTTGATMHAAKAALSPHASSVTCLVLAH